MAQVLIFCVELTLWWYFDQGQTSVDLSLSDFQSIWLEWTNLNDLQQTLYKLLSTLIST